MQPPLSRCLHGCRDDDRVLVPLLFCSLVSGPFSLNNLAHLVLRALIPLSRHVWHTRGTAGFFLCVCWAETDTNWNSSRQTTHRCLSSVHGILGNYAWQMRQISTIRALVRAFRPIASSTSRSQRPFCSAKSVPPRAKPIWSATHAAFFSLDMFVASSDMCNL